MISTYLRDILRHPRYVNAPKKYIRKPCRTRVLSNAPTAFPDFFQAVLLAHILEQVSLVLIYAIRGRVQL